MSKKEAIGLIKDYYSCNTKEATKIYNTRKNAGKLETWLKLLQDYFNTQARLSFYND